MGRMGCDIWGKWVWVREETELDLRKVAALGDTVEELSAPHQLHEEIYARVVLDHVVAAHDVRVLYLRSAVAACSAPVRS